MEYKIHCSYQSSSVYHRETFSECVKYSWIQIYSATALPKIFFFHCAVMFIKFKYSSIQLHHVSYHNLHERRESPWIFMFTQKAFERDCKVNHTKPRASHWLHVVAYPYCMRRHAERYDRFACVCVRMCAHDVM